MNKAESYKKASDDFAFLISDLREIYSNAGQLEDLLVYSIMERAVIIQKDFERIYSALEVTK